MIAALLAWQVAAGGKTTVTYRDVPSAVVSVHALTWRDGAPPQEVRGAAHFSRESDVARVECSAGAALVVLFARSDGAYVLDGPLVCPVAPAERRPDATWRRTLHVRAPPDGQTVTDISWLSATRDPPDQWPRCVRTRDAAECWGTVVGARGVLLFGDADRTWWTVLQGGGAAVADFQVTAWGRLVLITGVQDDDIVAASVAHAVSSAERRAAVRLETASVADAHVVSLGSGALWVYGTRVPTSGWIELRAPRAGPKYLRLEDVAHAPAALPLWIALDESRELDGVARGTQGDPASGAVVTMFRLIDPPARANTRDNPPRRVFAGERLAGASGEFHFDGLGDADYEIVAWHPQFGRGMSSIARGTTSVSVRLESAGQIRGRVIAAGKPLAGVDVISLPDPQAYAQATDLTDLKGGDGRTGTDGRFVVSLAPGGGGEVRVGGGNYPIRRFPLPRVPLPIVDLGDVDLGAPIDVTITLDSDPGCGVRATGPIGRSGLQVIGGTRTGLGLFRMVFPEEGMWEVQLVCGRDERPLAPAVVSITSASSGKEIRFIVR